MTTIRVALPAHLRRLAGVGREVEVEVMTPGAPTVSTTLDAVEARYPVLRGTMREHGTHVRRAYIRYFAGGRDISHDVPTLPLPESVLRGDEALCVIGAISGG